MKPSPIDLGDASSWCDSACDRCLLLPSCHVGKKLTRRLKRRQRQDGPDVSMADPTRDLDRALMMVEDAWELEAMDLDELAPLPVPVLLSRAQAVGRDLMNAAAALTEAAPRTRRVDQATAVRLLGNATLIAVKAARVAWALGDGSPWSGTCEPVDSILLLLERASAEVGRDGRALAPSAPAPVVARFAAAHGAIIDLLTPLIARVTPATRAELQARIAAGCAPSPFCRRSPDSGTRS